MMPPALRFPQPNEAIVSFAELDSMLEEEGITSDPSDEAGKPVILVVDDDATVCRSLKVLFRARYAVRIAHSGEQALTQVSSEVCTIILDVRMPDRDGFWTCDEIRKTYPDVPIIFHSAYQDAKTPYSIINDHRPFGYVMKDGEATQLRKMVDLAARMYRLSSDNRKMIKALRTANARGR